MTFPFLERVTLAPLKHGPPTSEVISPVLNITYFAQHVTSCDLELRSNSDIDLLTLASTGHSAILDGRMGGGDW